MASWYKATVDTFVPKCGYFDSGWRTGSVYVRTSDENKVTAAVKRHCHALSGVTMHRITKIERWTRYNPLVLGSMSCVDENGEWLDPYPVEEEQCHGAS